MHISHRVLPQDYLPSVLCLYLVTSKDSTKIRVTVRKSLVSSDVLNDLPSSHVQNWW